MLWDYCNFISNIYHSHIAWHTYKLRVKGARFSDSFIMTYIFFLYFCRICGYCVPRSDHHCVWTNCCIGQHNHHSFLAAIITFVVTGLWGVYLSFFTICTSKDNSIFHVDCSDVYANSRSSVVFVACWYTIIFSLGMCGLLLQQLVFISLNLTGDEFRRSSKRKSFCEVIRTHNHNKGFIRNWIQFLCPQDIVSISGEVV